MSIPVKFVVGKLLTKHLQVGILVNFAVFKAKAFKCQYQK